MIGPKLHRMTSGLCFVSVLYVISLPLKINAISLVFTV